MTIQEFETDPEYQFDASKMKADDARTWVWHNKISVDLKWVAAVQPCRPYTMIVMCGSGVWTPINISYELFMPLWINAKGRQ